MRTRVERYFGFYGLSVTEENEETSLFGDCTVRAIGAVPLAMVPIPSARSYHTTAEMYGKWGDRTVEAIRDFGNVPANSFLVVNRSAPGDDIRDHVVAERKYEESSRARAKEISAFLTCNLYQSPEGPFASGLIGEILHWSSASFELRSDKLVSYHGLDCPPEPLQERTGFEFSYEDLEGRIFRSRFASLSSLFDNRNAVYREEFARFLRSVTSRVADAIRAPSHVGQLLNSFMAIEMILGTSKKDRFLRRLENLIGTEEASAYRAASVVDCRNAIMHQGAGTTNVRGLQGISLALDALLNASALVPIVSSRDELEALLDIQTLRRRLCLGEDIELHPGESVKKVNLQLPYFRDKY